MRRRIMFPGNVADVRNASVESSLMAACGGEMFGDQRELRSKTRSRTEAEVATGVKIGEVAAGIIP